MLWELPRKTFQNLFEFMAVEWDYIKIGAEGSRRNVVGNSHIENKTGLMESQPQCTFVYIYPYIYTRFGK